MCVRERVGREGKNEGESLGTSDIAGKENNELNENGSWMLLKAWIEADNENL